MTSFSAFKKLIYLLSGWNYKVDSDRMRQVLSIISNLKIINQDQVKLNLTTGDSVKFVYKENDYIISGELNGNKISRKVKDQNDLINFFESYL